MKLDLITVPYDASRRGERLGRGPLTLAAGLPARLESNGHDVRMREVESTLDFPTDAGVAFSLARGIRERVAGALRDGRFPVVLAGNCMSCIGTVAGLAAHPVAVVWLDAHADLYTPDTTASGFLDGTALATLTGRCWRGMAAGVPGFEAVADARVVLVGARDLDRAEEELLQGAEIRRVNVAPRGALDSAAFVPALAAATAGAAGVYLHLDLDVLDPEEARANGFAAPNGLSVAALLSAVRRVRGSAPLRALALTAYDPSLDDDGAVLRAAVGAVLAATEA